MVDLDELPPRHVLVLLRGTTGHLVSFPCLRREAPGKRTEQGSRQRCQAGDTEDRTDRFVERERERLRWITVCRAIGGFSCSLRGYGHGLVQAGAGSRSGSPSPGSRGNGERHQMRGVYVSAATPEASSDAGSERCNASPWSTSTESPRGAGAAWVRARRRQVFGRKANRSGHNVGGSYTSTLRSLWRAQAWKPFPHARLRWLGTRSPTSREILFPCLEAVATKSVLEIGRLPG